MVRGLNRKWSLGGELSTPAEVRQFVFARDRGCLAARYEDELGVPDIDRHVCGSAFSVTRGGGLTLEHVTMVHTHLEGRRNDDAHTVALCGTLNGETMTLADRDMKEWFRDYLRDRYPECTDRPRRRCPHTV